MQKPNPKKPTGAKQQSVNSFKGLGKSDGGRGVTSPPRQSKRKEKGKVKKYVAYSHSRLSEFFSSGKCQFFEVIAAPVGSPSSSSLSPLPIAFSS